MRITYAEAGEDESGFKLTGEDLDRKTKLAMDKIMVVKSEISVNDAKTEDSAKSSDQAVSSTVEKISMMIIDDEPIVGKRLKPGLEKYGFAVETYTDSQAALDRLKEKVFDIVVTDLRMDEVDGIQILDYIMEHDIPSRVIMITAFATIDVAREALVKGAFDFVAKPFNPKELRSAINKAALSLGHQGMKT